MPPKKKGPSAEEKRKMLQQKVMASASFFNIKELEKMGASVGISGMNFKSELQAMLDDDLLVTDKIGNGNFYWKLPSEAANAQAQKLKNAAAMKATLLARKEELTRTTETKKEESKGESGREELVQRLSELEELVYAKRKEIETYANSDPTALQAMKDAAVIGYDSAVRWTDNIWCLESYMRSQFEGRHSELKQYFKENGYTDDFDYPQRPLQV